MLFKWNAHYKYFYIYIHEIFYIKQVLIFDMKRILKIIQMRFEILYMYYKNNFLWGVYPVCKSCRI